MWGRTVVVALALTVGNVLAGGGAADAASGSDQLRLGRGIDVFCRFGYLSISMRVVPRNDSMWLFREPTVQLFNGIDHLMSQQPRRLPGKTKAFLEGDFHMEFCDNLRQLLQAYFRDFTFEKIDRPWRAFTASWAPDVLARYMGINSSFVHGDHCYVLVRLSRFRNTVRLEQLPSNVGIVDSVANEIDNVVVGNVSSVYDFIKKYGSHYISSFITGNSLYQVFVYQRPVYARIKEQLKSRGVENLPTSELLNYFSPWFAEHLGQIRVASGNQTVERWANSMLRVHYYIFSYASLLKLHTDTTLLKTLNELLKNEALLQVDLKSLSAAFKDPAKRAWFEEVLDNYIKLWDTNM